MTRWLLTGVAATVAWGGSAAAQAPRPATPVSPPAARDGAPGGPIIVMKTAGQPDRRVQVIRSERGPDGKVLTEVKDLATGEVYTMTDVNPGGDLDAPAKAAPAKPAAKDAGLPRAKDRTADPLLGGRTTSGMPTPATPTKETKPRIFGRVFGKAETPPPPVAPPAARPAPAARPTAQPTYAPAPASATPIPVMPAPAATTPPAGPVQASATVAAPAVRPSEQMKGEIAQYVQDLKAHPRPSFRMEAATGLTDGRYAGRAEVKQALATAAKDDPAGAVRGHCIACLSKLGYADPEHVRRLHLWADDPDPAVRRAAQEAVAKLAPKS